MWQLQGKEGVQLTATYIIIVLYTSLVPRPFSKENIENEAIIRETYGGWFEAQIFQVLLSSQEK